MLVCTFMDILSLFFWYLNFPGGQVRVDRDMFMRFHGGEIGHNLTRAEMNTFKTDHDDLDIQSQQDRITHGRRGRIR